MHRFFVIVDRVGLKNSRVAASMKMTAYEYANFKNGRKRMTPEFRAKALDYLRWLGLRRSDGKEYQESDLFDDNAAANHVEIVA